MEVKKVLMNLNDTKKNQNEWAEHSSVQEDAGRQGQAKAPSFELENPVNDQYVQLLTNIANLCGNRDLLGILLEAHRAKKGRPPVVSTFQREREQRTKDEESKRGKKQGQQSAAKSILIRAVLRPLLEKKRLRAVGNTDEQLLSYFSKRVLAIKFALESELMCPTKNEQHQSYIDLAG